MSQTLDKYVEKTLDLVPLELPGDDLIHDRDIDALEALNQSILIEINIPSSRFGPGRAVAIHPGHKRALYMGVSGNMLRQGLKKTAILDAGFIFNKCCDKPTTAGVIGCVIETFMDWLHG